MASQVSRDHAVTWKRIIARNNSADVLESSSCFASSFLRKPRRAFRLPTSEFPLPASNLRTFAHKTFPRTDFLKLATQKGNDLLLPKRQKNGGSPCSFSISWGALLEACVILRRSLLTTVSNKKATLVKFRSGKRTQFNTTNTTKQTFAADVFFWGNIDLEKRYILV